MMALENRFRAWVYRNGGPIGVGKLLGVTDHAVRTWLRGESSPRTLILREIVRLSRGQVVYSDVLELYENASTERAKRGT